ncbi:hypothetical protein P22_3752 [Propionispora sp. 2/2-37]|uniref:hypothetical protein n=1 Tax=Propionispora sp. 2/2-37 TaxID=1677858 RepID=UPI0006BB7E68|nr:hypothetical protein [Propionispora sp. 2/2-37]CUH97620.1 hypothetical protein P22_3752 [Propionispora sp. 2/2-37]
MSFNLYSRVVTKDFKDFILNEMPLAVAIANEDIRVQAINRAARGFFCTASDEVQMRKCGELLRCVHASRPGGCGSTPACVECVLRRSILLALEGQTISRNKGSFHVFRDDMIVQLTLLITASSINYDNSVMAIVLIEDVSLITELEGLLPLCCSCHKIRDENGNWISLERYIAQHSEAEFTHDYCPQCLEELKRD